MNNFVVHKSSEITYSSDIDVLAIRLPFVYEEVGGSSETDWDRELFSRLTYHLPIGLICEVKTGAIERDKLFREEIIRYGVGRFGFSPNRKGLAEQVLDRDVLSTRRLQIAKILFSNNEVYDTGNQFLHISIPHVKKFINSRIQRYPEEKYRDRTFFSSILVQYLIDDIAHSL